MPAPISSQSSEHAVLDPHGVDGRLQRPSHHLRLPDFVAAFSTHRRAFSTAASTVRQAVPLPNLIASHWPGPGWPVRHMIWLRLHSTLQCGLVFFFVVGTSFGLASFLGRPRVGFSEGAPAFKRAAGFAAAGLLSTLVLRPRAFGPPVAH